MATLLVAGVACSTPEEPPAAFDRSSSEARNEPEDFADYRSNLARQFPREAGELLSDVLRVSGGSGPGAVAAEGEYLNVLRTDPEAATQLILRALEEDPRAREPGLARLQLLYTLQEVPHPSQVGFLESTIIGCPSDPPPAPPEEANHHRDIYGPTQDHQLETILAMRALEQVAVSDRSVAMIGAYRAALDRIIDERRCHRAAMATAVQMLVRYSPDRAAEKRALETRLGSELAYLTDIELVHDLPGGNLVGEAR